MALNLTCPTCNSDNTQRLNMMKGQQSFTGMAGQTTLAAALNKPGKPWAYLLGFVCSVVALMLCLAILPKDTQGVSFLVFIYTWWAVGRYITLGYLEQIDRWETYLEENFICLRCGAMFHVPALDAPSQARIRQRKETGERLGNQFLGYAVGAAGLILLSLLAAWPTTATKPPAQDLSFNTTKTSSVPQVNASLSPEHFYSKYGKPDEDDSTEYDDPRPPVVTRLLSYHKEQLTIWFAPDAKVGAPPPYKGWRLTLFQDEVSKKYLSQDEAEKRLQKRLVVKR